MTRRRSTKWRGAMPSLYGDKEFRSRLEADAAAFPVPLLTVTDVSLYEMDIHA